jgi:hypothetical protein
MGKSQKSNRTETRAVWRAGFRRRYAFDRMMMTCRRGGEVIKSHQ